MNLQLPNGRLHPHEKGLGFVSSAIAGNGKARWRNESRAGRTVFGFAAFVGRAGLMRRSLISLAAANGEQTMCVRLRCFLYTRETQKKPTSQDSNKGSKTALETMVLWSRARVKTSTRSTRKSLIGRHSHDETEAFGLTGLTCKFALI